jgi:hypothetical protein
VSRSKNSIASATCGQQLGLKLVADDVVVLLAEQHHVGRGATADDFREGNASARGAVVRLELAEERRAAAAVHQHQPIRWRSAAGRGQQRGQADDRRMEAPRTRTRNTMTASVA